mmetsp:Transcript_156829/g.503341  ORF Transcript_156829/g.503341 Transcript_156829/m.503341 type:complete len:343 (+) Transcript_156829:241-1269(+)
MQPLDELPQRTRLRLGLARRLLCDCASLVLGPGTDLLGLGPGPGLQLGGLSPRLREQGPALLLGPGALGLVGAPTGLLQPALLLALPAELLRALLFCGLRLLQHGGGLFLRGDLGTLLGLCGCALLGGGLLLSSRLGGRSLIRLLLEHRLPLSFDAGHHLAGLHLCPDLDDAKLDLGASLQGLDLLDHRLPLSFDGGLHLAGLHLCPGLDDARLDLGPGLQGLDLLDHRLPLSFDSGLHLAGLHLCPGLDDARLDLGPGLQGLDLLDHRLPLNFDAGLHLASLQLCGGTMLLLSALSCRANWRHFYLLDLCHGRLELLVLSLIHRQHVIRLCPGLFQDLGLR